MSRLDFMRVCLRRSAGAALFVLMTGIALAEEPGRPVENSVPHSSGAATNADMIQSRKLRDELLKSRQQDNLLKSWDASLDSLQGVMLPPPAQRPSFTPAQALMLKEKLEQQKYWMFANPEVGSETPSPGEANGYSLEDRGGFDNGTPQVLKRYFEHPAVKSRDGGLRGVQDDLDFRREYALDGKSARDNLVTDEKRSVFDRAESAASRAISRLFDAGNARQLPIDTASGGFSEIFAPPASIPMERSLADQQHLSTFQDILNSPAQVPASVALSMPGIAPVGGAAASRYGGLDNFSPGGAAAGFNSLSGGPSLPGAPTPATVAQPLAPRITEFQPVKPPTRKF